MTKEIFTPHAMAKMAMCVALISIGGYIAFPTPFSPVLVTATTLALGITALVLPPKQTAVAILLSLRLSRLWCWELWGYLFFLVAREALGSC